jgi:Leucine-rich repeat (LRR) protein
MGPKSGLKYLGLWPVFCGLVLLTCMRVNFVYCVSSSGVGSAILSAADPTCDKPVSDATYEALYALYNSTGGTDWSWKPESSTNGYIWNFTAVQSTADGAKRPCKDQWQGLTCELDTSDLTLCAVTEMIFENFNLNGPLPNEIGNITSLQVLHLSTNLISGTLPRSLGALSEMEEFYLDSNAFTGDIPTELGRLTESTYFELGDNFLVGTIPTELYGLINVQVFYLPHNHLTGSLSPLVGNLVNAVQLDVSLNLLSQTLPTEIGLMTSVSTINLVECAFSGSIPSELGLMSGLTQLLGYQNYFSQNMPTEIGLMTALYLLDLDLNMLSGTLPTEVFMLPRLENLDLSVNHFTGPLGTEIGNLNIVTELSLGGCYFSGPIPEEISNCKHLVLCYLNENLFSGALPASLGNLQHIHNLIFAQNLLTSSLPTEIGNLTTLQQIATNTNYLTGQLTSSFPPHLIVIQFEMNHLTGDLFGMFNYDGLDLFSTLVSLDVSFNAFTGSFPSVIFALPALNTLLGGSNCFSGALTCPVNETDSHVIKKRTSSALQVIDLNGLSSGSYCRHYMLPTSILPDSGYYPKNYMTGTLPSCIWEFENLTDLYLVGNGFTGPIFPPGAEASDSLIRSLTNLSLASNELTGTIPAFLANHEGFIQLDLSSNRLHGSISSSLDICSNQAVIDLSVNRLSGALFNTGSCNFGNLSNYILQGNMLTFSMAGMNPETHSEALAFYGSSTLDTAMIVASPIFLVAIVLLWMTVFRKQMGTLSCIAKSRWLSMLGKWNSHWQLVLLPLDWIYYFNRCIRYSKLLLALVGVVLFTFAVLESQLKSSNHSSYGGTYQDQYRWYVSAAYLHGTLPVVLMAVLLLIGMLSIGGTIVCFMFPVHDSSHGNLFGRLNSSSSQVPGQTEMTRKGKIMWVDRFKFWCKIIAVLIVNFSIVGLVNTGYLVEVLDNNPEIQLIQITLSLFKLVWNTVLISNSLKWLTNSSTELLLNPLLFRFLIKLINFVVIPCLATSLISDSCYLKLFQQQTAPLLYDMRCSGVKGIDNGTVTCTGSFENLLADDVFTPPFIYSFQCTSAIIANYVPVLLYSYIVTGLLIPGSLILFMLITAEEESGGKMINACNRLVDVCCGRLFEQWLPQVLRQSVASNRPSNTNPGETEAPQSSNDLTPLFPLEALIATQLLNAALFGTFGVAFPYLGAAIACSAVFEIWTWLIAIGKYHSFQFTVNRNISPATLSPLKNNTLEASMGVSNSLSAYLAMSAGGIRMSTLMAYQAEELSAAVSGAQNDNSRGNNPSDEEEKTGTSESGTGSARTSIVQGAISPDQERRTASLDVLFTIQSVQNLQFSDAVILIALIFVFWGALFFDMTADLYGTPAGLIVVLVVMFCGPVITVIAMYCFLRFFGRANPQLMKPSLAPRHKEFSIPAGSVDNRFSINSTNSNNPLINSPLAFNSDFAGRLNESY